MKTPTKRGRTEIKNQAEVRIAICSVCGKSVNAKFLYDHMKYHKISASTLTPYSCTICSKSFKTKVYLRRHTRKHTGTKSYKCAYCEKQFLYWTTRFTHQIKCHSGEFPFNCSLCDMEFCRKSELSGHMVSHTGIKKNFKEYVCDQCDYICENLYTLKLHKTVHSDKREVKCDLCDKTYKTVKSLKVHMRNHTNKRDYICLVCTKSFTTSSILRKHVHCVHPEEIDVLPPLGTILKRRELNMNLL